ncbi:hypothetical protein BDV95DRAFT_128380 [Massariosphaeria phaeospora]|uniref:Uncharacterized protein n=1 Tax=Massariosphaeria phaeospora TaxID=100035 RepID=A0A7C8I1K7_9PLEO|nr:hypothetical protein BDV95DRAFT_128380 [Massariosphaeria phaeospora]
MESDVRVTDVTQAHLREESKSRASRLSALAGQAVASVIKHQSLTLLRPRGKGGGRGRAIRVSSTTSRREKLRYMLAWYKSRRGHLSASLVRQDIAANDHPALLRAVWMHCAACLADTVTCRVPPPDLALHQTPAVALPACTEYIHSISRRIRHPRAPSGQSEQPEETKREQSQTRRVMVQNYL